MLVVVFFHRQHLAGGELQVAITALAGGQGYRRFALQRLSVELLIRFVDEYQPVIAQAKAQPPYS